MNTRFMALDLDPEGFAFTASADFPYASPLHFRIELAGRTEDDGEISSEPVETAFGADSPGLWKLEDFSCNGTYVNGQRVEKSCLLNRGDWIFAAGALFMFWNRLLLAPPAFSDGPSREMANVHKRDAPSGKRKLCRMPFNLRRNRRNLNWKRSFGMNPTNIRACPLPPE
ncbi:FHA domain-containing protein [Allobaculum sp. Allo2]|nr:FHA domain-containing protein [Allobaculum sp. Allo2]